MTLSLYIFRDVIDESADGLIQECPSRNHALNHHDVEESSLALKPQVWLDPV